MQRLIQFTIASAFLVLFSVNQSGADIILSTPFGTNDLDTDDPSLPDPDPFTLVGINAGNFVTINGPSIANVSGGNVAGEIFLSDQSQLNVSAGTVNSVSAAGDSTINVTGGSVGDFFGAAGVTGVSGNSQINISGGTVGFVSPVIGPDASVVVSGGSVGGGIFLEGSFQVTGGSFDFPLFDLQGGIFELVGSDFVLTTSEFDPFLGFDLEVQNPVSGDLSPADLASGTLSGTLLDGSAFTFFGTFVSGDGIIRVTAVPEPNSAGFILLASCPLLCRRRRS